MTRRDGEGFRLLQQRAAKREAAIEQVDIAHELPRDAYSLPEKDDEVIVSVADSKWYVPELDSDQSAMAVVDVPIASKGEADESALVEVIDPIDMPGDFAEPFTADDDWESPVVFIDDDGPGLG